MRGKTFGRETASRCSIDGDDGSERQSEGSGCSTVFGEGDAFC